MISDPFNLFKILIFFWKIRTRRKTGIHVLKMDEFFIVKIGGRIPSMKICKRAMFRNYWLGSGRIKKRCQKKSLEWRNQARSVTNMLVKLILHIVKCKFVHCDQKDAIYAIYAIHYIRYIHFIH